MAGIIGSVSVASPALGETLKDVVFAGLRVPVPADWPVYDLEREPTRCVRYDQHAVYLGTAGPDADCPTRLVGRTETIQIERTEQVVDSADQQLVRRIPETGVVVTGTYGEDRPLLQRLMQGITVQHPGNLRSDPGRTGQRPSGDAEPENRTGYPRMPNTVPDLSRGWTSGRGFDTCAAPSLRTMAAWRSAFSVANMYIGGAARGCGQHNLTHHWVRAVHRMGYRLIPTYVGLQAPCTAFHNRFTARNAAASGGRSADDAIWAAQRLGLPGGTPIYYDMEAYNGRARCRQAVLRFLDAWTRRLELRGYLPGVYSSAATGIRDLGRASGIAKPQVIWFARWDGKPSVLCNSYVPNSLWVPHRRIKQYRGDHQERHGGVRLRIDTNEVDGRVY
jgi:hypothetical protein